MADIQIVWDDSQSAGEWSVQGGQLATGSDLQTAVLVSLFTDRVAQDGYVPDDGTGDRRGWWADTLTGDPIGSRLWQLYRRKIANRTALQAEARDISAESLQWLTEDGIAASFSVSVSIAAAGVGSQGTMLAAAITITEPTGAAQVIRALWQAA